MQTDLRSIVQTAFDVEGMSCSHCVAGVKKALLAVPGVTSAEVNLESKLATVVHESALPLAALIEAINLEGYEARIHG